MNQPVSTELPSDDGTKIVPLSGIICKIITFFYAIKSIQ